MTRVYNKNNLIESFRDDNVLLFKEETTNLLNHIYEDKLIDLKKSLYETKATEEESAVTEIESASKSYGGGNYSYGEGVLYITVPNKQAALDFSKYLDSNDNVVSYEVAVELDKAENSIVDLESLTSDVIAEFTFIIFLKSDFINYEPVLFSKETIDPTNYDQLISNLQNPTINESLDETTIGLSEATGKKIIKFKRVGDVIEKLIKIQCPPGQKFDPTAKQCVVESAKERRDRHISQLEAAKKRGAEIAQIQKRTERTMNVRSKAGY